MIVKKIAAPTVQPKHKIKDKDHTALRPFILLGAKQQPKTMTIHCYHLHHLHTQTVINRLTLNLQHTSEQHLLPTNRLLSSPLSTRIHLNIRTHIAFPLSNLPPFTAHIPLPHQDPVCTSPFQSYSHLHVRKAHITSASLQD